MAWRRKDLEAKRYTTQISQSPQSEGTSGYSSATCNMGLTEQSSRREDCIMRLLSRDAVCVMRGLFNDIAPINIR
jgi:hypothetical protein